MSAIDRRRAFRLRAVAVLASCYFAFMFFAVGPAAVLFATRDAPFALAGAASVVIGAIIVIAATVFVARLVAAFIREGDGTHVPIDPPRRFVYSSAYRRVRNPMYLAYVATVMGEAILFGSAALLVYAAALWLVAHLYVVLREEPLLERRFGDSYRAYCAQVPRWGWPTAAIAAPEINREKEATPES